MSQTPIQPDEKEDNPQIGGRYAKYVLFVLVIVYIFNFIDRQILSILAEDIKADLCISDAEIGFLYGTAFAVFYAIFGIPLGRLADTWTRKSLISVGLFFWSVMTALSGTARSFASLAAFRIGVGVGEASASPAAFSMLSDYFPPRLRTTALAIYSSGVYIGAGIGIFLGGMILDTWANWYPDHTAAPMQLKGWHVAFFAVGLPGVMMALWVWTLREPVRGMSEGIATEPHPHPFREAWTEFMAVVPGLHIVRLLQLGADTKVLVTNIAIGLVVFGLAWLLYMWTGTAAQWLALGIGVYAAVCWVQSLMLRDPATFRMIFGSTTLICACIGFPFIAFVTYALNFWGPPFFQRVHGVSASETGIVIGLSVAVGGWLGVTLGGVASDFLLSRTIRAKLYVAIFSIVVSIPTGVGFVLTDNLTVAYICFFIYSVTSPMWIGPGASTVNDLVMPRMRAIGSAYYIMMVTFIGLALGPYTVGQVSDAFAAGGATPALSLTNGMLVAYSVYLIALVMLIIAAMNIEKESDNRDERAAALGESV